MRRGKQRALGVMEPNGLGNTSLSASLGADWDRWASNTVISPAKQMFRRYFSNLSAGKSYSGHPN